MNPVPIVYFSDVLCIWAHIAELRVEAVKAEFGEHIRFDYRFCSVFGDTARKMATTWRDKGGYEGFNAHLMLTAEGFPEITVNPEIWLKVRPASSTGLHLLLKAIALQEASNACPPGAMLAILKALRKAFFEDGRDIAQWKTQAEVCRSAGLDIAGIEARIQDGQAYAALASDYQDAHAMGIQGSPSFVLNEGRQKLYGNVGFRIMEANIQELLREPRSDQASWC